MNLSKHKKSVLPILLAGAVFFTAPSAEAAWTSNVSTQLESILSVEGTGVAQIAPDQATVVIGVTNENADARKAQAENARIAQAVKHAILATGVAEKDIQTNNYNFYPLYSNDNKKTVVYGYRVDNNVVVVVNDVNKVGSVIDAALAAGANDITSLNFGAKNTTTVRKAALERAVADARAKADILAAAIGKRIVGIRSVAENVSPVGERNFLMAKSFAAGAAMDAATPIAPGSLEMNANVYIDYILGE
ncbi:SIMPL domain-containing protein [Selenomonas sp. TAMA-11512]|uniref:SIMPL domain-containing protein n=1 Tax=Selenomonas sp. TAMA-11512 TaxID=3095337 RepID=UPI003090160C|nr:SIMPL domain-containing protein [Selenomonas sp. TAMA-11512]